MIYISPPFGNYISLKGCTSVLGTYTYFRRKGLIKQIIKTLRPVKGGWRNSIGLRNKGIVNIKDFKPNKIYSVCALKPTPNRHDLPAHMNRCMWDSILDAFPPQTHIELNIGCPNITNMAEISNFQLERYVKKFNNLTVKVPPTTPTSYIEELWQMGIKKFHLSNTLPVHEYTDNGILNYGVSGYPLKKKNLLFIERIKRLDMGGVSLIAGGGIYTPQDVQDYHNVGATDFSLSTIFFTPWKVSNVLDKINSIPSSKWGTSSIYME
jgi:dihydroorotate dehydrogenase